jgi:hypothetical protein
MSEQLGQVATSSPASSSSLVIANLKRKNIYFSQSQNHLFQRTKNPSCLFVSGKESKWSCKSVNQNCLTPTLNCDLLLTLTAMSEARYAILTQMDPYDMNGSSSDDMQKNRDDGHKSGYLFRHRIHLLTRLLPVVT